MKEPAKTRFWPLIGKLILILLLSFVLTAFSIYFLTPDTKQISFEYEDCETTDDSGFSTSTVACRGKKHAEDNHENLRQIARHSDNFEKLIPFFDYLPIIRYESETRNRSTTQYFFEEDTRGTDILPMRVKCRNGSDVVEAEPGNAIYLGYKSDILKLGEITEYYIDLSGKLLKDCTFVGDPIVLPIQVRPHNSDIPINTKACAVIEPGEILSYGVDIKETYDIKFKITGGSKFFLFIAILFIVLSIGGPSRIKNYLLTKVKDY